MNADRSLPELTKDAAAQLGDMFRNELRLARAEAMENVGQLAVSAAKLVAGLALGVAAFTLALFALAYALGEVVPMWGAALIAAGIGAAAAYLLIQAGRKAFAPDQLTFPRTTRQVATDINLIKEKVSS